MAEFKFQFELGILRVEYVRCGCVMAHLVGDVEMLSTIDCANREALEGCGNGLELPDEAFSLQAALAAILDGAQLRGRGQ